LGFFRSKSEFGLGEGSRESEDKCFKIITWVEVRVRVRKGLELCLAKEGVAAEELPANDPKGVRVDLLIVRLLLQNLRREPGLGGKGVTITMILGLGLDLGLRLGIGFGLVLG
jgi:hypothetical protein